MTLVHTVLRYTHITSGLVGLTSGAIAMMVRKGSRMHTWVGRVFVISMLAMAAAGGSIAYFINPVRGNALGGMLTFYLVLTGWLTAWRRPGRIGSMETVGAVAGGFVASVGFLWAAVARTTEQGTLDGYPWMMYSVFASVALMACLLDVRLIARGGITVAARTTRHLWRMCAAMFVATGSFFIGQAKFFPAPIRESGILPLPVIAVVVALVYWLLRIRILPRLRAFRLRRMGAEP